MVNAWFILFCRINPEFIEQMQLDCAILLARKIYPEVLR